MMDPETKRNVTYILAGTVAVLLLIGAVVPEARQYVTDSARALLLAIGGVWQ